MIERYFYRLHLISFCTSLHMKLKVSLELLKDSSKLIVKMIVTGDVLLST
jgi:hypothetical protein